MSCMCMVVYVLQDMDEYAPWALECQSRPLYTMGTNFKNTVSVHTSTGAANHSITEAPNQFYWVG